MAYLLNDEEDQQRQQMEASSGGQSQSVGLPQTGSAFAGQGGIGSGSPQQGTGGTPQRWVNIQNYLGANKSNDSGANLISGSVDKVIQQDRDRFKSMSDDFKGRADEYLATSGLSQDDFNKKFGDLASRESTQITSKKAVPLVAGQLAPGAWNTSYRNPEGLDEYNTRLSDLKGRLDSVYSGPTSMNFAVSDDLSQMGDELADRNRLRKTLDVLYAKSGTPLSTGARSLQKQLDLGSDSTEAARLEGGNRLSETATGLTDEAKALNESVGGSLAADRDTKTGIKNKIGLEKDALASGFDNYVSDAKKDWESDEWLGTDWGEPYARDWNPYYKPTYHSATLDFENAGFFRAKDPERLRYNAILDLLGMSGKIGKTEVDLPYEQKLQQFRAGGEQRPGIAGYKTRTL